MSASLPISPVVYRPRTPWEEFAPDPHAWGWGPPPSKPSRKRRNPKRAAQKAQRDARKTNRRNRK